MIENENGSKWCEKLDDFKPEYFPVKCNTILQFYTLRGKTSKITIENIEPIRYVHYALFSPQEGRYYYKFWHSAPLEVYYFYRRTLEFSGADLSVENLRNYVEDGNIWMLYTQAQVNDTTEVLKRLWKGYFTGEGKIPYPIYLQLLQQIIDYEDYQDKCKGVTGFKTVSNQYDTRIKELWDKAYNSKKAE